MSFDIETDLRYPLQDDDRAEKLLIGTLLTLFGGFVVPLLPVYGYLMRVARGGMTGAERLPEFAEWESLFVEGTKALVIGLVYQLPPILVGLLSFGGLFALGSGNDAAAFGGVLVFAIGLLVAAVLWILFGYLGVVAVLTFARERELGAAFNADLIRPVALDTDFAIDWLYGLGLLIGLNILVGVAMFFLQVVAIVPIIGWLIAILGLFLVGPLGAAVSFYAQIVAFRVWSRGYADSRDRGPDVARGAGSGPAVPSNASTDADVSASPSADRTSGRDVDGGPTETS